MSDAGVTAACSALGFDCSVLWSEEIQNGAVIDRRLRIANPFRAME